MTPACGANSLIWGRRGYFVAKKSNVPCFRRRVERRGVAVPEHGDGRLAIELVTYLLLYLLLDFLPSTARNISQGEE
jgi:hypothetical protein